MHGDITWQSRRALHRVLTCRGIIQLNKNTPIAILRTIGIPQKFQNTINFLVLNAATSDSTD